MFDRPRLIIAGLSGGAGKTIVSLGVARALARRGLAVKPFKKGPDYIDAAWLGLAARREASNLDPFLMPADAMTRLFLEASERADVSVVEGNRGLFDGKDVQGSASTAELARQLDAPVILAVNCSKTTRTVAALIMGCRAFEPGLRLAGVILNQTAGPRHRDILRRSVEAYCDVPVLGVMPRLDPNPIPERHMGLVSDREYGGQDEALDLLARIVEENVDLDAVLAAARAAPLLAAPAATLWSGADAEETSGLGEGGACGAMPPAAPEFPKDGCAPSLDSPRQGPEAPGPRVRGEAREDGEGADVGGSAAAAGVDEALREAGSVAVREARDGDGNDGDGLSGAGSRNGRSEADGCIGRRASGFRAAEHPRIGVVRDAALWFYYPENLEALRRQGAELAELSLLTDDSWPELDGLYLGGGFPETQAERLSANVAVRERVRSLSAAGLPIYAECGGLMYLCRSLLLEDEAYPMAGVFPVDTELCPKPQGLGYTEVEAAVDNPFFPKGMVFVGHEFHYSRCVDGRGARLTPACGLRFALAMRRGAGMVKGFDGLLSNNTFAAYNHIHVLGAPVWAERFVAAARLWSGRKGQGEIDCPAGAA